MFAAAGIVVTLMRTPMSAPDFAVVRLRTPAAPAADRDEHGSSFGSEISDREPWSSR